MKVSELKSYFGMSISVQSFRDRASNEINEYRKALELGKEVIPVYCEADDVVEIDRSALVQILNDYLGRNLDEISIQYICDILSFEQNGISIWDQKVKECVQILSEPKLNFPITVDLVKELITWLQSEENTDFKVPCAAPNHNEGGKQP